MQDTDGREGYISGTISFGPNAINGVVDEGPITGYAVFLVDDCGEHVGVPVATVAKRRGVPQGCCQRSTYTAEVKSTIYPVDHGTLRLAVVPFTPTGPLPVGALTRYVVDYVTPRPTPPPTATPVVAIADGCRRLTAVIDKAVILVAFASTVADLATLFT